jgi:hypothetical protein
VYFSGTVLTWLSALALFPLGQRLFVFFDLNLLVRSEICPSICRHIAVAGNSWRSISITHHHSKKARRALEQFFYIDDRAKEDEKALKYNLPVLSDDYTFILLHYLHYKHTISQESYWFPRTDKPKQWFLSGESETSTALNTSSQLGTEKELDLQWFENKILDRLASHIEIAFQTKDFNLALTLIGRFQGRIPSYVKQLQFDVGMQELTQIKVIIEQAFASPYFSANGEGAKAMIGIADTWAALGGNLCLEALSRMITFEKELERFFEADEWSEKSLRRLPALLQVELSFIIRQVEFEQKTEGRRLSKKKFVQQLSVKILLQHYEKVLHTVCHFSKNMVPEFVESISNSHNSEAATQVVLANLHCNWKLQRRFDDFTLLIDRYQKYEHYTEKQYALGKINIVEMSQKLVFSRDRALAWLGDTAKIEHIFEPKKNDKLPDHFGQIYFELAESCIEALEKNDQQKLSDILPMFVNLALLATKSKFSDPLFDVNDEFRVHLMSTVINDLASVFGYAILYGAYFENKDLADYASTLFNVWVSSATNKQQYLNMVLRLSNPHSFSSTQSPRSMNRINWKISFENRVRSEGFADQMSMGRANQHPNKIVKEFLQSHSDASHLFFAIEVVPLLDLIDFDIDYHITHLVERLSKRDEEV